MITLMVIGIIIFACKMLAFVLKAAIGITKGILMVVLLPVVIIGLLIGGMTVLALPILILGLIGALAAPAIIR